MPVISLQPTNQTLLRIFYLQITGYGIPYSSSLWSQRRTIRYL